MDLKDKYIFKPYNSIFPKLFDLEKKRLVNLLTNKITIEHIGSTAISNLGGKGVIDILVIAPKSVWSEISEKLKILNYEYKRKDKERESEKLFFMANLPDKELGTRLYHIHLTYLKSHELKNSLSFRDYLRKHPKASKEYSRIKKLASEEAQKLSTKDEMRDAYGKVKEDFIQKIIKKI